MALLVPVAGAQLAVLGGADAYFWGARVWMFWMPIIYIMFIAIIRYPMGGYMNWLCCSLVVGDHHVFLRTPPVWNRFENHRLQVG